MSKEVEEVEYKVLSKDSYNGFKNSWAIRNLKRFSLVWFIFTHKKVAVLSFKEQRDAKGVVGIKARVTSVGQAYRSFIYLLDNFVSAEREELGLNNGTTLGDLVDIYGGMIRVVKDPTNRHNCYFDKGSMTVYLDPTRFKTYDVLRKSNDVRDLTNFVYKIKVKYA